MEDGRAVAKSDWNNDGAIDLILRNRNAPRLRVLQNNLLHNNWLQVRLVGNGITVNRDGIGTKVVATIGDSQHMEVLTAGDGYLSQSSKMLYFGMADAKSVDKLEVTWPDGSKMSYSDVACNQQLTFTQGVGMDTIDATGSKLPSDDWSAASDNDVWRIPLVSRLPVAEVPIPSAADPGRKLGDLAGRPVLLNFWSTTCAVCLAELDELAKAKNRLNRFNLQVVTMCTDGSEMDPLAAKLMQSFGFDKLAGTANAEVVQIMQVIVNEVGHPPRELSLGEHRPHQHAEVGGAGSDTRSGVRDDLFAIVIVDRFRVELLLKPLLRAELLDLASSV